MYGEGYIPSPLEQSYAFCVVVSTFSVAGSVGSRVTAVGLVGVSVGSGFTSVGVVGGSVGSRVTVVGVLGGASVVVGAALMHDN